MEARLARLESDVAHLRTDVADIKTDQRSLREKVDSLAEGVGSLPLDLKGEIAALRVSIVGVKVWGLGLGLTIAAGVFGTMARAFGWI